MSVSSASAARSGQLLNGAPRTTKRLSVVLTAFFAIMRRDMVVTWREFISFLVQVLLQPLFFLFVFGDVLPRIGLAQQGFATILLPGIVALTVVVTALQGVTLPLTLDLGYSREIDDRLLAPLPVSLVAVEKVIFASMRGLIAGALIFPLGFWILGNGFQVRGDAIGLLIGVMILTAIMGSALGLTIGTIIQPEQIGLMFSLIFTPLFFTGCVYNPWGTLGALKWFQIVTLFNPLTYASEGLRNAMIPVVHGQSFPTLGIGWVLLALSASCVIFIIIGMRTFYKRVVS